MAQTNNNISTKSLNDILFDQQKEWNSQLLELLKPFAVVDFEEHQHQIEQGIKKLQLSLSQERLDFPVLIQYMKSLMINIQQKDYHILPSQADHVSNLGTSLGTYLSKIMKDDHFDALSFKVNAAVIHWLHTFLKLPLTLRGYFRTTNHRARFLLAKKALARLFPLYSQQGYATFKNQIPILLSTRNWNWLEGLRLDLALPQESVKIISSPKDLENLLLKIKESNEDIKYIPFMLLVSAGSSLNGYIRDDLTSFLNIATNNNIWLHVEGTEGILTLGCNRSFEELLPIAAAITQVDSMLLNSLSVIGYESQPNLERTTVFYKVDNQPQSIDKNQDPSTRSSHYTDLAPISLDLWFALQFIGCNAICTNLDKSMKLSLRLYEYLSSYKFIEILSSHCSLGVLFRYIPDEIYSKKYSDQLSTFVGKSNEYILYHLNQTDVLGLSLRLFDRKQESHTNTYIFFNPYYSNLGLMSMNLIKIFSVQLSNEIKILNETFKYKELFEQIMNEQRNKGIRPIKIASFVGLGTIKFFPLILLQPEQEVSELSQKMLETIDLLTKDICSELEKYGIFHCVTDESGHLAIGIGVDREILDEEKCKGYCSQLISACLETEKKFADKISEFVQQGIKEAEERIRRESIEEAAQEGIMRKIPLVGSVVNWWSPRKESAGMKGKRFNILKTELSDGESIPRPRFQSSNSQDLIDSGKITESQVKNMESDKINEKTNDT